MIAVLCIGQYDKEGKFRKKQWECFIEWCKKECNKLIVYSQMPYRTICSSFKLYCDISEIRKPDEAIDISAYEIDIINELFWNYIKNFNFNIDVADSISHMYFFKNEKYIAALEIVDYENYILMEIPIAHEDELLPSKSLISENIQLCVEAKTDIDDLLRKENWRALGKIQEST